MRDTYPTPEGFELHRPLLMPDARAFTDVLTIERPWDFTTMNHRSGVAGPERYPDITRKDFEKTVSRFCSVRHMPDRPDRMAYVVTPTDAVLDLVFSLNPEPFAFFDTVSWEAIYHRENDRVLILGSASRIIASRYVAYVDPATVPLIEE